MRLKLRVVPNAKRNEVVGTYGEALKVKIQAPATEGKANAALCEYLASVLGVPVRAITLVAGEKSRDKVIEIRELEEVEALRRLGVTEEDALGQMGTIRVAL